MKKVKKIKKVMKGLKKASKTNKVKLLKHIKGNETWRIQKKVRVKNLKALDEDFIRMRILGIPSV